MQATKYTVKIVTETLSLDSIASLILDAVRHLESEKSEGELCMDDGDMVSWEVEKQSVTF